VEFSLQALMLVIAHMILLARVKSSKTRTCLQTTGMQNTLIEYQVKCKPSGIAALASTL
jgi:hypothetical protein